MIRGFYIVHHFSFFYFNIFIKKPVEFQFSFVGKKDAEILIIVRNMLGHDYYAKGFILDNDVFVQSINLSGTLTPGMYTVIASSSNQLFTKRIVIK